MMSHAAANKEYRPLFPGGGKPWKIWRLRGKTVLVNEVFDHSSSKFQLFAMIFAQKEMGQNLLSDRRRIYIPLHPLH
jgi:hypothetical protein